MYNVPVNWLTWDRNMISVQKPIRYPTSDGRPMAETDLHFHLMADSREILDQRFADDPNVYVSGNLLMYCVPENKRRHVAPDVFVVKGVEKKLRENYLVWEEGKSPDAIIEITSSSTRREDQTTKRKLYRDVLKVREYFLFDPRGDYLKPTLQGFRLLRREYVPIDPVANRLPSTVLGLHLERSGMALQFFDPKTGEWLPTLKEQAQQERAGRLWAEAALERLEKGFKEFRAEFDALKRKLAN
jgi:Uma2 family endonuclease